ncbi:MAG: enoyl-[acyl-carrier-protein] reductase [Polyangiaceae bacterium]|nr:enoyl-[acyl-carrier-protein] reductase [Polyangiaceae bacterium]
MLSIDLSGRRAIVVGVADASGFGFAIAKALSEAGASVCITTWPPALRVLNKQISLGKLDAARRLGDGSLMSFEKVYALDVAYDQLEDVPEAVRQDRRYDDCGDFSLSGLVRQFATDFGHNALDVLVHCVANAPEVKKPLLETSRGGYLSAVGHSSYSMVALVQRFAPLMRPGGAAVSITYVAGERVIAGYGGGMSSAKAALENDTRVLAFEAGRRYGLRVNTISAGPLVTRAATALGFIDRLIEAHEHSSPLRERLEAAQVASVAAFLASPLASAMTGTTVYVDHGFHAMAWAG